MDLSRFGRVRALVVGDVMLDRYWFGDVERISPEAPVPVISIGTNEERMGGAANVANNVRALESQCTLLSVVGNDEAGGALRGLLDRAGIRSRLHVDAGTATTVKLRIIARNQQLLRADFEHRPGDEVLARCLDDFNDLLGCVDVVILSDYGKGGLTHIREMIEAARDRSVPVMVDPKGRDFSRYRGATLVTPNRREFEEAAGPWIDDAHAASRARELLAEFGFGGLLVTRSEHGMSLYRSDRQLDASANAREVFDVSGAGDTVIASVAVAMAAGLPDEDCLLLANAAAGIVVGKLGTATASLEEVRSALESGRRS